MPGSLPAPPLAPDGNPVSPEQMAPSSDADPRAGNDRRALDRHSRGSPPDLRAVAPSPLCRALRLEQALGTLAKIFYKNEGVSPAGSHKPNSAVPQASTTSLWARRSSPPKPAPASGVRRSPRRPDVGLPVRVFMVGSATSRSLPPLDDADLGRRGSFASPTNLTNAGRNSARRRSGTTRARSGSRFPEAVEEAAADPDTCYTLGSVLNHVLLHQTVIGPRPKAVRQDRPISRRDLRPCGGGSSFGGIAFPSSPTRRRRQACCQLLLRRGRADSCPTLTKGRLRLRLWRRLRFHADDEDVHARPRLHAAGIHAGGLRYHGDSLLVSQLLHEGSSRRWPCRRWPPSRPASSSPAPRASSRRRNPVTPSAPPSTSPALQGDRRRKPSPST